MVGAQFSGRVGAQDVDGAGAGQPALFHAKSKVVFEKSISPKIHQLILY